MFYKMHVDLSKVYGLPQAHKACAVSSIHGYTRRNVGGHRGASLRKVNRRCIGWH